MVYNTIMEQKSLALALGGGGVRGLAHIGVLKVLVNAGIRIDFLAGTSFGGIVAIALASGKSVEEMEDQALRFSQYRELVKLVDLTTHRRGLLHGGKVRKYLANWLGEQLTFGDLKIPTILNAVNLSSGQEVILASGPVMPALFGTICIPGIFSPVYLDGQWLVDGGVLNNVPVNLAGQFSSDIVIGIDVLTHTNQKPNWQPAEGHAQSPWPLQTPEFFMDLYRSMLIMVSTQTRHHLESTPPDLMINPPIDTNITMFSGFTRARETIAAGEQAALALLPEIENMLFN
jgi:NTE family protein